VHKRGPQYHMHSFTQGDVETFPSPVRSAIVWVVQERMKQEIMAANQKQIEMKGIKAREAAVEEERARTEMLAKFAEDDRIEQMNAQKRRMKQLEHKREVCDACHSCFGREDGESIEQRDEGAPVHQRVSQVLFVCSLWLLNISSTWQR
jgi:hypothetical protein